MKIDLGSEIEIEGRKYVVAAIKIHNNKDGRIVEIHAYEPLVFMKFSLEADQRRDAMMILLKTGKIMDKEYPEKSE